MFQSFTDIVQEEILDVSIAFVHEPVKVVKKNSYVRFEKEIKWNHELFRFLRIYFFNFEIYKR